ncbi:MULTISPECIES: hypothetical protein [unclassified Arthrobacter]|uniref:hypothetical protein n=1 Tax=unclassified Arthrobacter TaxID=235627 RepID=UPI001D135506|nr:MULTISPECIES: hypothetical protein [unclassified Arthrobacter]MCC3291395.1 hypothetical protein [Arthrobacter sp. zg-Y1110]MCC3301231.1 hypothetical protein [Arthrobacter sp. zg-Y895]MCC3302478.1 hypothetical protein [Arthrobacter sp. zg-Y895]UWX83813.1 hypothetical protein N2K99_09830 [Arthrobacter sp. zg-Y1110]
MRPSREAPDLLHAIANELQDDGPLTGGTMFRSPGLRTGPKIVALTREALEYVRSLPG